MYIYYNLRREYSQMYNKAAYFIRNDWYHGMLKCLLLIFVQDLCRIICFFQKPSFILILIFVT